MRKSIAALLIITAVVLVATSVASAALTTIVKPLSGKAETPKGDPDGTGTAKIQMSGTKVCFNLTWSKIGNPTAAHIHKGAKGVAGPVVIPFFGGTAKHKGCVTASKSLVKSIQAHPGNYYVNIHNAKYPGGALRAQL